MRPFLAAESFFDSERERDARGWFALLLVCGGF